MGALDRVLGSDVVAEAEKALWALDDAEERDPALHARNCKKRWSVMVSYLRELQKSNREVRLFLLVITLLVAVNASPQIASIVQAITHTVFGAGSATD